MSSTPTYQRNRVNWALWRYFTVGRKGLPATPPREFTNRIKRLLDVDRTMEPERDAATRYAFMENAPPGKGVEISFTDFDTFCLGVGLDMQDQGFKQAEVVFVLRSIRSELAKWHAISFARGLEPSQFESPSKDYPDSPAFQDDKWRLAEWRIFMVLQRNEIVEAFPESMRRRDHAKRPFIWEPGIFDGVEALSAYLNSKLGSFRKGYLAEIGLLAWQTRKFLEQAPIRRRGRS